MTTFNYKGHDVIIRKHRGELKYTITITKDHKVVKVIPDLQLPLGRVKTRAKDFIGF